MEVFRTISSAREYTGNIVAQKMTLGLVPTMGALHQGHLALIDRSCKENDATVVSIFVNPTQFNNQEDLLNYPNTWARDMDHLSEFPVSAVFAPSAKEMYPHRHELMIQFGSKEKMMEGASRPGHFNGVGIVVSKLFNIIRPTRAYFGQKDLQQLSIVRQLESELSFGIDVVAVPTVRETDGLAMSSRNERLGPEERIKAVELHKALEDLQQRLVNGQNISSAREEVSSTLGSVDGITVEYLEVVDSETLNALDDIPSGRKISLCVAAFVGNVRLLDNIYLYD